MLKEYYWNEILQLANEYPDVRSLIVEFPDIERFSRELSKYFLNKPEEAIEEADKALQEIDLPIDKELQNAHVRIVKAPNKISIRNLRSKHLDRFITIEGMIRKVTEVRPRLVVGGFLCLRCGHVTIVPQPGIKTEEPYAGCEEESCGKKGPFKLDPDTSVYVDAQRMQVQESPENLKGGEQPQSLDLEVEDDITGFISPGDRVIINGVLKSRQRVLKDGKSNYYDLYLSVNSIEKLDKDFEEIEITPEDEEKIIELSKDPEIYFKMRDSIAPSIYGHESIKEAICLQLFGGVVKNMPGGNRTRGDIHMLLVGDPGIAKSQVLRYVAKLSPRGVFSSGKSASAAGLTAAAVRDEMNEGRWTIEGGALVMADMGIAAIDEMDKMTKEDTSALHEAMEQQTITVSKAGILATLKSRCALLGAANPKYGRFDPHEDLSQQVDMPPALLSRFDIIYLMLDKIDHKQDLKIARHILKTHSAGEKIEHKKNASVVKNDVGDIDFDHIEPPIDSELMRKYVAYGKKNIYPIIEEAALDKLEAYYMEMRDLGGRSNNNAVPVTARQLEALVRLTEAGARLRLSNEANIQDADRAIKVLKECMDTLYYDVETGLYDVDKVISSSSNKKRSKIKIVKDLLIAYSDGRYTNNKIPLEDLYNDLEKVNPPIDRHTAEEIINMMKREGSVFFPDISHIKNVPA